MTKQEALDRIDAHKNNLVHPVELLKWTWLRVIILQIPEEAWNAYVEDATKIMRQ